MRKFAGDNYLDRSIRINLILTLQASYLHVILEIVKIDNCILELCKERREKFEIGSHLAGINKANISTFISSHFCSVLGIFHSFSGKNERKFFQLSTTLLHSAWDDYLNYFKTPAGGNASEIVDN